MHRCSSSEVGMCSCGLFHAQGNCFSMLFSLPNHKPINEMNTYPISSSSSSVDCTLSLGTPSTRQTDDRSVGDHHRSGLCMSWDIYQTKQSSSSATTTTHKSSRGNTSNNLTGDSLLARRCANCDTTSTPLWRNGPRGPKSLCNACGIRYKKEERRATTTSSNGSTNSTATIMDPQHMMNHHHHHSWGHHAQTQKEYRFMEDDNGDSNTTIPFLSWRLNVPDRPSLVHDFT